MARHGASTVTPDEGADSISGPSLSLTTGSSHQLSSTTLDFDFLTAFVPPFIPDIPAGAVPASDAEQQLMFSRLAQVFKNAEQLDPSVGDLRLEQIQARSEEEKTAANLQDVRNILDQLWWSKSVYLPKAADILANGSRDRESKWPR
jgi:hypothetical protein